MSKLVTLHDESGTSILPKTVINNVYDSDGNRLDAILQDKGITGIVFDTIIDTQQKFDNMVSSNTWNNATCVLIKGQYTTSQPNGIVIPPNVKNIVGMNNATILVTGITGATLSSPKFGLGYRVMPTIYSSIDGIKVQVENGDGIYAFYNCTHINGCTGVCGNYGKAFVRCNNITDCVGVTTNGTSFKDCNDIKSSYAEIKSTQSNKSSTGFVGCNNLSLCSVSASNDTTLIINGHMMFGYLSCNLLTGCSAYISATGASADIECQGFSSCTSLSSCLANVVSSGSRNGYGMHSCTMISGCDSSANSSNGYGYSYNNCKHISSCTSQFAKSAIFNDCTYVDKMSCLLDTADTGSIPDEFKWGNTPKSEFVRSSIPTLTSGSLFSYLQGLGQSGHFIIGPDVTDTPVPNRWYYCSYIKIFEQNKMIELQIIPADGESSRLFKSSMDGGSTIWKPWTEYVTGNLFEFLSRGHVADTVGSAVYGKRFEFGDTGCSGLQIREAELSGRTHLDDNTYAPSMVFHWSGTSASRIFTDKYGSILFGSALDNGLVTIAAADYIGRWNGYDLWVGSQTQYDTITTKDPKRIYIIY